MRHPGTVVGLVGMFLACVGACSDDPTPGPTAGGDAGTQSDAAAPAKEAGGSSTAESCPGLAFTASCKAPDHCFDFHGWTEENAKTGCAGGTYQTEKCETAGHIGACSTPIPSLNNCQTHWYFAPTYTTDKIKGGCGGTFIAP